MKKITAVACSIMLLAALSGCSNASSGVPATDGANSSETQPSKDEWTNYLSQQVAEFSVSKAECSYTKGTLEVQVKFTNISDRPIAAIDAGGTVNDVFGEKQMAVDLSVAKKVAPGKSVNAGSWGSSCYSLNPYIAEQAGLLDMDPENINLVVEVTKIAFVDGEIIEF